MVDLTETLAERLFYAEQGHTGMTWDQLDDEFGKGEYRRTVARMCEGLWDQKRPLVVLDLGSDNLWQQADDGLVDALQDIEGIVRSTDIADKGVQVIARIRAAFGFQQTAQSDDPKEA